MVGLHENLNLRLLCLNYPEYFIFFLISFKVKFLKSIVLVSMHQ